MQIEIKVWLYDVLNAIIEIESYSEEHTTFEEFKSDLKTKRAVERNIENNRRSYESHFKER